jgi:iron(III) transport system substrate-binding protein
MTLLPVKKISFLVCLTTLAPLQASSVRRVDGASAAPLSQLVQQANKEGRVVYATSGETPEVVAEMNRRFNKKFNVNIAIESLPLTAAATVTRVLQEKSANRLTIDLLHPSYTLMNRVAGKGVLAEFDWVGTFGTALPGIKEAAARVPDFLKNMVLDYQHLAYVPIYNTKLVSKTDIPKKWTDFLDPKWKEKKIIIDPRGNSLYLLFLAYGEEWVLDFAAKMAQQDPLFESGQPAIARAVAKGEAPLGITNLSHILAYKKQGLPVDAAPQEVVAIVPQVLVPVDGSPNPNAAKLFAAWVATEGLAFEEGNDFSGRAWKGTNWALAKELDKVNAKLVFASSPKEIQVAEAMIANVQKVLQRKR